MRNVLSSIIGSSRDHNVRARNLSGRTPIGGAAGPGKQTIDIGDILKIEGTDAGLASALMNHELKELSLGVGYPVQTEADWMRVFETILHPAGLDIERRSGYDRQWTSTDAPAGASRFLRTGEFECGYPGFTAKYRNTEGGFNVRITR
jgi:hypothetical protein